MTAENVEATPSESTKTPLYKSLWVQVLVGIALAVVVGFVRPKTGVALKPLGDAFIKLISMIITLVIFCTVVSGIAGMKNLKQVGRVGGKALLTLMDILMQAIFGVMSILMRLSPIGALGAMAFTVGNYGIGSLGKGTGFLSFP